MNPEAVLLEVGDLVGQTYRLERLIGQGSMGTVFEAAHVWLDRRFAVKILTGRGISTTDSVNRFHREARVTSGLRHPNIIEVTDYNLTPEGIPYLVMELLQGESLRSYLKRSGKLGLAQAGVLFDQICCGLAAAHDQAIIHRDLKPGNIFVCQEEQGRTLIKILDFGLSKILDSRSQLTKVGTIMGSIPYCSPEQLQSAAVDQRADLYSLGVVLFEMLTGQRPFTAESVGALVQKITHTPAPPLCSMAPEMSASVETVLHRVLQKKPAQRYAGVTEFRAAFFAAAGLSSTQVDVSPAAQARGPRRTHSPRRNEFRDAFFAAGGLLPTQVGAGPAAQARGSQRTPPPRRIEGPDTSAETVTELGSSLEVMPSEALKSRTGGGLARHEMPTLIEGGHGGHGSSATADPRPMDDSQPGSDPISYLPTEASDPSLRPPSAAQPAQLSSGAGARPAEQSSGVRAWHAEQLSDVNGSGPLIDPAALGARPEAVSSAVQGGPPGGHLSAQGEPPGDDPRVPLGGPLEAAPAAPGGPLEVELMATLGVQQTRFLDHQNHPGADQEPELQQRPLLHVILILGTSLICLGITIAVIANWGRLTGERQATASHDTGRVDASLAQITAHHLKTTTSRLPDPAPVRKRPPADSRATPVDAAVPVDLPGAKKVSAPARPRSRTGILQVTVFVKRQLLSAQIYLDGKPVGMTPLSIRNVPAGRHKIQARAPGYRHSGREITVKPQRINSFVITLDRAEK